MGWGTGYAQVDEQVETQVVVWDTVLVGEKLQAQVK